MFYDEHLSLRVSEVGETERATGVCLYALMQTSASLAVDLHHGGVLLKTLASSVAVRLCSSHTSGATLSPSSPCASASSSSTRWKTFRLSEKAGMGEKKKKRGI